MYSTRRKGSDYEKMAADYLMKKGYTILDMNYRISYGEIDIVASCDGVLVFVEVKYRSNSRNGTPAEAVDVRKQRQISRVALTYLGKKGYGTDIPVRFDVITILGSDISHIENAFSYAWY
ncbi:MAG: YraN family protein [Clostridiales bacterium]|nr:YraN family protein [Clostridiales bacterium]